MIYEPQGNSVGYDLTSHVTKFTWYRQCSVVHVTMEKYSWMVRPRRVLSIQGMRVSLNKLRSRAITLPYRVRFERQFFVIAPIKVLLQE